MLAATKSSTHWHTKKRVKGFACREAEVCVRSLTLWSQAFCVWSPRISSPHAFLFSYIPKTLVHLSMLMVGGTGDLNKVHHACDLWELQCWKRLWPLSTRTEECAFVEKWPMGLFCRCIENAVSGSKRVGATDHPGKCFSSNSGMKRMAVLLNYDNRNGPLICFYDESIWRHSSIPLLPLQMLTRLFLWFYF